MSRGYQSTLSAGVVEGLQGAWRDEFPGSALQSGNWTVRQVGVGMSMSVASSKLTIATGVTSGDVLELISGFTVRPPCRLLVSLDSISQRIANQEFSIELIRADTLVDVFTTDGVGFFFSGTSATAGVDYRSVSQGDAGTNLTAQTIPTTAGASVLEIDLTTDECWFYNGTVDVAAASKTNSARFTRKVPDPAQSYMVRIRAKNTGVPASTTNFVIDSVLVEDYTHLGVEIARSRGSSAAGEQLPVNVASGTVGTVTNALVLGKAIFFSESTTPLAGAATFTAPGRELMNTNSGAALTAGTTAYPGRIRAFAVSDQIGTLLIEASNDNVTYDAVLSVATSIVDGKSVATADVPVYSRYIRVRYVNGAVLQTFFRCGSLLTAVS
jgi:hypothetical protein